jgi:hypothetical protein
VNSTPAKSTLRKENPMAKGSGKSKSKAQGSNPFSNMPKAMKDMKAQGKGKGGKKGY